MTLTKEQLKEALAQFSSKDLKSLVKEVKKVKKTQKKTSNDVAGDFFESMIHVPRELPKKEKTKVEKTKVERKPKQEKKKETFNLAHAYSKALKQEVTYENDALMKFKTYVKLRI